MKSDLIKQLKEIIENENKTMISSQDAAGDEHELVCLINTIIDDMQKSKKKFLSLSSALLYDIDLLAEILGKISLGNFDIEIPSMRVPDMDTVRIGILDMERKLKEGQIARDEREKALHDLKVLRGLIPICASCKKIRDDNGYWSQIESYIKKHSEADFSHGICPECAGKLYPELLDENGKFIKM